MHNTLQIQDIQNTHNQWTNTIERKLLTLLMWLSDPTMLKDMTEGIGHNSIQSCNSDKCKQKVTLQASMYS